MTSQTTYTFRVVAQTAQEDVLGTFTSRKEANAFAFDQVGLSGRPSPQGETRAVRALRAKYPKDYIVNGPYMRVERVGSDGAVRVERNA